jgi:hypothetical protein
MESNKVGRQIIYLLLSALIILKVDMLSNILTNIYFSLCLSSLCIIFILS